MRSGIPLAGAIALLLAATACTRSTAPAGNDSRADAAGGERLFRLGLLGSGRPLEAKVEGDVVVSGAQFSCASCHGRSGMGSEEGGRRVLPVTQHALFSPSLRRAAYTDQTLARAIRDGVDSAGRRLDPLMPRFQIPDADMARLVAYLHTLSTSPVPGVESRQLHFATVVTPGVSSKLRDAMLSELDVLFNGNVHDPDPRDSWGEWRLHVWNLDGGAETWPRQLEARYREQPVFALLSGLGGAEWGPVHRFCESHQIPCVMPNIETPPEIGDAYYSLYFSGGVVVEAKAVAAHLARENPQRVLQVFHDADAGASRAARTLSDALRAGGRHTVVDVAFSSADPVAPALVLQRIREERASVVVLWLRHSEAAAIGTKLAGLRAVYLSSTLLGDDDSATARLPISGGIVAHPHSLRNDLERRLAQTSPWIDHSIDEAEARIRGQTFLAFYVLGEGIMHMTERLDREYLLESIDHLPSLGFASPSYPEPSFGPGQRLASKGCYLIPLAVGGQPEWIVP